MRKILTALMAFGLAFTMNAQTWQKEWRPADEMKGIAGQYEWTYIDEDGVLIYGEQWAQVGVMCSEGIYEYTLYGGSKYIDARIGFYEGSSLSYQTTYTDCYVGSSGDMVIFDMEQSAPILAWLSKGRRYSVRFIVERYNRTDFDFTVTGK